MCLDLSSNLFKKSSITLLDDHIRIGAVHWLSMQLRRNTNQGICLQGQTTQLKASDVKTCLVSNKHGHVTLKRVYNPYLTVTKNDGGHDVCY